MERAARTRKPFTVEELFELPDDGKRYEIYPAARTLEALELRDGQYETDVLVGEHDDFRPRLFPDLTIPMRDLWRRP